MLSELNGAKDWEQYSEVLILIVMEDALRESKKNNMGKITKGLNPYCYGRCSQRI